MRMKQKVLREDTAQGAEDAINSALQFGWFVQSVTVNPLASQWIIVLYRND